MTSIFAAVEWIDCDPPPLRSGHWSAAAATRGRNALIGQNWRHPQAHAYFSLDEIRATHGCARFSLVQIPRCHPVAADKLLLSSNRLLLIFTYFIQTHTYYTFLESLWPYEFDKIVSNMF